MSSASQLREATIRSLGAPELLEWLLAEVAKFNNELEDTMVILSEQSVPLQELRSKLDKQRELLADLPPLNLVVVGGTKAGKSTLVNAMLSRPGWHSTKDFHEVLPRRMLAETNAFWKVETSKSMQFEFEYGNDHSRFDAFADLASYIHTNYGRGSVKDNALVTLRVPALFSNMCGGDFCLIDSPGLSEAGFPHFVHEFLHDNPHILIYALPITAGCLTTVDDQFLTEVFKSSKIQKSSTCVFVLTCYDRALGEADLSEVQGSVQHLTTRIEELFGAKAFATSNLCLQRGSHNPEWPVESAIEQLDKLLKFMQKEFLRNSRVVVLKGIFSAIQDLGYGCYHSCIDYHKVQYKGLQTQRMFALFDHIEKRKTDMVDRFKDCLASTLEPRETMPQNQKESEKSSGFFSSSSKKNKDDNQKKRRPPTCLQEHVVDQLALLNKSLNNNSGIGGKMTSLFKKDFWDQEDYQRKLMDQLRPSIKAYVAQGLQDLLRGICVSFLNICTADILDNARHTLDATTFQELSKSLDDITNPQASSSTSAAARLASNLNSGNVLGIAIKAVDKAATAATSRAIYVSKGYNPVWQRSAAAHKVAYAICEQMGDKASPFYNEARDIATTCLDDMTRSIKKGVQDYYRTINASVVLERHPQLQVLHDLLEDTNDISNHMKRLEAMLEMEAEAEEQAEKERLAALKEAQRLKEEFRIESERLAQQSRNPEGVEESFTDAEVIHSEAGDTEDEDEDEDSEEEKRSQPAEQPSRQEEQSSPPVPEPPTEPEPEPMAEPPLPKSDVTPADPSSSENNLTPDLSSEKANSNSNATENETLDEMAESRNSMEAGVTEEEEEAMLAELEAQALEAKLAAARARQKAIAARANKS